MVDVFVMAMQAAVSFLTEATFLKDPCVHVSTTLWASIVKSAVQISIEMFGYLQTLDILKQIFAKSQKISVRDREIFE